MNLFLVSRDEKGEPNIHPDWYIYEKESIFFATETNSKKIRNIKNDDRVVFSIASEKEPFIGIKGKGVAKILTNTEQNLPISEKIVSKYMDDSKNNLVTEVIEEIKNGDEVIVEIQPEYFSAWSFSSYFD